MVEKVKMDRKYRNIIPYIVIIFAGMICGNIAIQYPGLYYDAVFPDYLSVTFSNSSGVNTAVGSVPSYFFFPKLGNLYHGTLTMFIQTMITAMCGSSVVIYRNTCLAYFVICCCLVYRLLDMMNIRKSVSFGVSVLMVINAAAIYMTRTQYFIMLPGVIFLLLAAIFYLKAGDAIDTKHNLMRLVGSGVCMGVAFYDYYCYLFFAPAFMFLIIKNGGAFIRKCLIWLAAFLVGCSMYFLGYFEAAVIKLLSDGWTGVTVCTAFIVLFWGFCILQIVFLYKTTKSERAIAVMYGKIMAIAVGAGICAALFICITQPAAIRKGLQRFEVLNLSGEQVTLIERMVLPFKLVAYCVSLRFPEHAMFQEKILIFPSLYLLLAIGGVLVIWKKKSRHTEEQLSRQKLAELCAALVVSFYVCCIPLVSRMQSQHFVAFAFLLYLVLGVIADRLFSTPKGVMLLLWIIVICMGLNIYNITATAATLTKTGGRGGYTDTINRIADEALEHLENGEKEAFISLEWGFRAGFTYLTDNKIICRETINDMDNISDWDIQELLDEGYKVILVTAYESKLDENETYFGRAGQRETYYSLEGEPMTYMSVFDPYENY